MNSDKNKEKDCLNLSKVPERLTKATHHVWRFGPKAAKFMTLGGVFQNTSKEAWLNGVFSSFAWISLAFDLSIYRWRIPQDIWIICVTPPSVRGFTEQVIETVRALREGLQQPAPLGGLSERLSGYKTPVKS
jgi:hypothetical protein